MSYTFTKLFSSITESTIWVEPHPVRITWITMLAMADRQGRIFASIPGLANRARVTVEEAEVAIGRFLSPDKYSRTPDFDGRRIEPIDGGWRLLNHQKYRSIQDDETTKEAKRRWWRENRGLDKTRKTRKPSIQAEADADTTKKERKKESPLPENFEISERVKTWAGRKGFTGLEAHLEFFVGRMRANGKKYVDWDEAFMNCVREDWSGLRKGGLPIQEPTCGRCNGTLKGGWTSSMEGRLCHKCKYGDDEKRSEVRPPWL